MADYLPEGWARRLFLWTIAALLLLGLMFLAAKIYHQIDSNTAVMTVYF